VFCTDLRTKSAYFATQQWLVFITETEGVYCAVRLGSLNRRDCFILKGLNVTATTSSKRITS
jgi:hypothetical protein